MVSISNFLIISIPLTIESLNRGKSFFKSISFNSTVNLICCPIKIESLSTRYLADWLNKFRVKTKTEADIFNILGLDYVEPHNRLPTYKFPQWNI